MFSPHYRRIIYLLLCQVFVLSVGVYAASPASPQVAETDTIRHIVGRNETLYGIALHYHTTQDAILRLNPKIKGKLEKGTSLLIKLPTVHKEIKKKSEPAEGTNTYRVNAGETLYQLEKRFGCSRADLLELNPDLKEGLKSGMVLHLPQTKKENEVEIVQETVSVDRSLPATYSVKMEAPRVWRATTSKTFEIALFLPIGKDLDDSTRLVLRANNYLEFYSGFLLAAEKLTSAGMKLKIHVYDTGQQNELTEQIVHKPEFLGLDLIVGPVFPEHQKLIAELSAKNHIPMISPLSPDSRLTAGSPGYYQVNPGKQIRILGTADYLAQHYAGQNIILLHHDNPTADEEILFDRLKGGLGTAKVHHFNLLAPDGMVNLEKLFRNDKENVLVLADDDEANVSVVMNRLNTLSKTDKFMVFGLLEYTKMQSINIENLHNFDLHYLAPYFIDFSQARVNEFIGKYRQDFTAEPTPFSFQGYDVGLYFMAALGQAGRTYNASSNVGVELLQSEPDFMKASDFGGWVNRSLFVIEYTPTYDVRLDGKIRVSENALPRKSTDKTAAH